MTAYYYEEDYLTFNDNIGGLSGVSALSGYYKTGSTVPFSPPAGTPISQGAGMQLRWAWWDENNVFYSSSMGISYYVWGAKTLTARYQQQYFVKLDTDPSALPTPTVVIQGSTVSGPPPISGWFDSGASVTFWAPDVAVLVAGKYMWQFDTSYYGWWYNGGPWTNGNINGTGWRYATYAGLNTPLNVTAKYKEYFYVEWDTLPLPNMGGQAGFNWYPAGFGGLFGFAASVSPNWVFKQCWDSAGGAAAVSLGIGVNPFYLDGGSLSTWHSVKGEYWNVTTLYIAPFTTPKTAPAACTYFNVTVYAANFLAERQRDLKAIDFHIYYNSTLIKLTAVEYTPELNALWGTGNWFLAKSENFSAFGWDYYWFTATAINGAADFQGSKPIVKLTFHIEVDPCYPTTYSTPIGFSTYYPTQVTNSTGDVIMTPELIYPPATYTISAPQPVVKMDPATITINANNPQSFFDVFVKIEFGLHIEDFYIVIDYPNGYIEPVNVTFGDYLAGPTFIQRGYSFNKGIGRIYVYATEDASSPLGNGNGTLFSVKFKVMNQVFWNNPMQAGPIAFVKSLSYLSCLCDLVGVKYQTFNAPIVNSMDATYKYVPLPGDLNFDGYVDLSDLRLLAATYNPGVWVTPGSPYDVNLDGYVNIIDLVLVANHWHPHP
jgi:hypothetical protein